MRRITLFLIPALILAGPVGCSSKEEAAKKPTDTTVTKAPEKAAQPKTVTESPPPRGGATRLAVAEKEVEAGCGLCTYKLPGVESCTLAAKIDGKPYLVVDADVDAHQAGLCSAPRKAKCSGSIQAGKFVATSFELIE